MMSIATLLQVMTAAQIRAAMVTTLVTLGIPADKWRAGGVASTILTIVSQVFATFQNLIVQGLSSGFLETAAGGWLTLLAAQVYGVTRPPATFASGQLTLTNSGGGIYSFASGAATFLDSITKKTYTNVTAIALAAFGTQTIVVQCTEAGTAGSAIPGGIDTIVTTMLGVTCTNVDGVVGSDELDDPGLRALCKAKLGSLSVRGPRGAYLYAIATALNGGVPVNINRSEIDITAATGVVNISLASPSGAPSPGDLLAVEANIEIVARPDCVTVNVNAASEVLYTPHIIVWVKPLPGNALNDIQLAAETAIDNYLAIFPVGGVTTDAGRGLFATGVDAAIGSAITALGGLVASIEGTFDLALTAGQVATNGSTLLARFTN